MFSMDAFTTVVLGWVIAIIIVTFGCFAAMLLSFMSEEDEQCEWCGNAGAVANGPDKARICPLCRATFQGIRIWGDGK